MVVQRKFGFERQCIVKHGDAPVADDDKPLLLGRMQPSGKNMCIDAAGETQHCDRKVGARRAQRVGGEAAHFARQPPHDPQHDCEVVWGDVPQCILLGPHSAEVEPARVKQAKAAKPAALDPPPEHGSGRMVFEDVPDLKDPLPVCCQVNETTGIVQRESHGFLHEQILAGCQYLQPEFAVSGRGRGEGDGIDVRPGDHIPNIGVRRYFRHELRSLLTPGGR